jgi:hypothetical protein
MTGSEPDVLALLVTWGPGGLMLALILTGLLQPKKFVDLLVKDRDRWVEAADQWRGVAQTYQETIRLQAEQLEVMRSSAELQARIMETLARGPSAPGGST